MRELARALALISVLSLACREAQNPVAPASPAESPDYAVYDAVLDGLFQNDVGAVAPPRYVLFDSTMTAERHGCGGLCGDWGFVLLERRSSGWVILRRVITAVS